VKNVNIVKTLLIVAVFPVLASAATHRYIVELTTEPAARFASRSFGAHKESLARPEVTQHLARIKNEQDGVAAQLQVLGGTVVGRTNIASNVLVVDLPDEKAASLMSVPGVARYHKVRHYRPVLDQATFVHKLPQAYSLIGGASNAGTGIKVAILDTGIDITQPAFNDTGFTAPAGFPKVNNAADTKFTNNKVIAARSYVSLLDNPDPDTGASDESGHGTGTADCAAGGLTNAAIGATTTSFAGVAPGAFLGSYKIFGTPGYNDSANDAAILKAIDDAVADGMDVISYSVGGFPPIPQALDTTAGAFSTAISAGVVVVAAAGNDGNGSDTNLLLAYDSTALSPTVPALVSADGSGSVISVGASSNQRGFWAQLMVGTSYFAVDAEDSNDADSNNNFLKFPSAPIVNVTTVDSTGQACNSLPAKSLTGAIALISISGWDPNTDNCNPATKMTNVANAGAVAAIIYDNYPEDLNWFSIFSYAYNYSYFNYTGIPAGFITLSDGNALAAMLNGQTGMTANLDFNFDAVPLSSDRVAFFSSRGPNADYEIKPDMVAVGEDVLLATESINLGGDLYASSGLTVVDGTSQATPMVSGAAAILKAARPGLTALQYRSLLINSTSPISDWQGGLARVMEAGAGLLNVNSALTAEATVAPATLSFGTGDGTQALSKSITVTNIGAAADTFAVTVVPRDPGFAPMIDQTSLQLAPGATATINVSIPGGALSAGEYEGAIHIQGTNTPTDTHVPYWFGIPSPTPFLITDMGSDTGDARGQLAPAALIFRLSDAAGIVMENSASLVTVQWTGSYNSAGNKVNTGNAKVGAPYMYDAYSPGTIAADVTPSTRSGLYDEFTISVGNPSNPTISIVLYIQSQ
jgi:subtilisin family serine protease